MSEHRGCISIFDKINRRSGHIAALYREKGCVLIWGGYMEHIQENPVMQSDSEYHATDEIWRYDCFLEIWERKLTRGDIPPRCSGSCGVIVDHHLYVFGGYVEVPYPDSVEGNSNRLYRLNLKNWTWELLLPEGGQPVPCDKLVGWTHSGKLYFFGGFGPVPDFHANFSHVVDPSTTGLGSIRGWNNQLVAYDPSNNRWEWPSTEGPVPFPRAAHAADLTGDCLYLFGGRYLDIRSDDLHCLNMTTMTWSGNLSGLSRPRPEGRSWHSFTFVSPDRAILYGGLNQWNSVLNDCWLYESGKWMELTLAYDHGEPRCWHAACLSADGALVLHSGLTQPFYETSLKLKDHAQDIVMIHFTPKSLLRLCLDTVLSESGKPLRSEWCMLPHHLQEVLQLRENQWQ